MPTIVGILTFMSMINFVLNWVEHEKSFITSGTDYQGWKSHIAFLNIRSSLKPVVRFKAI